MRCSMIPERPGTCGWGARSSPPEPCPHFDTLTFTHDHASWVDQSWAFDVLLALLVDTWGWSAAIGLASLGLATLYAAMARGLIRDGTSPVVAVVVALFATAIGAIHFLIRPHLFTFAFVYLTLRACQKQHQRGGWAVAAVPLYTALLANLHGGFVALPVIVASAALGHAVSGALGSRATLEHGQVWADDPGVWRCRPGQPVWRRPLSPRRPLTRFERRDQLDHRVSIRRRSASPRPRCSSGFSWPWSACPSCRRGGSTDTTVAHVLVWLHLALTSIRNAPLFALAAAPALATLLDGLPLAIRKSWKRDDRSVDLAARGGARHTLASRQRRQPGRL